MVKEERTTIVIQVQPNARLDQVTLSEDGIWHLRIAAPPTQGKANRELLKFLGEVLGVARSNLTIKRGITSRRKVIAVKGLTESQVTKKLSEAQI